MQSFFINLMRLKGCDIPEFQGLYQSINDHFSKIATLLNAPDSKEDKIYKSAIKLFKFSEVNGINLGFSESEHGAGFGEKLRKYVISDAFDIVKKGVQYPEIFQLVRINLSCICSSNEKLTVLFRYPIAGLFSFFCL